MATPEGNLEVAGAATAAPVDAPNLAVDPADAWIFELRLDDPVPGLTEADGSYERALDSETRTAAEPAPPEPAKQPAEAEKETPAQEAAPAGDAPAIKLADESATNAELSEVEKAALEHTPEEHRPEMAETFRRQSFMKNFLNPDKPAIEIAKHLESQSPSRYGDLEAAIFEQRLSEPEKFAATLFEKAPEAYAKMANEVYRGDPSYFTRQVTGRDGYTPESVQTAIDFYERHKDQIQDDGQPSSPIDAETLEQMAEYFPDAAGFLRQSVELAAENARLKQDQTAKTAPDPNAEKLAQEQQQAEIVREVNALWDLGRETVRGYVNSVAYDPTPSIGAGIHVTAEERKAAPNVATLKDLKAKVLFDGLEVDGKPLLNDFEHDFTAWGKEKPAFDEKLKHIDRFTQAREKDNVVSLATQINPFAKQYLQERLKHPIFAAIDQLINSQIDRGSRAPVFDRQIAGHVPAHGNGASSATGDWLLDDAIGRARKR